jgi:hypothetical protein
MKRPAHLALVFVAAAMHLVAPVVGYAKASAIPLPGDLCTVSRAPPANAAPGTVRLPASSEHHCAQAPCCAGGAVDASAPPPVTVSVLRVAVVSKMIVAAHVAAEPVAPILVAQPRGPPRLA